MIAYKIQNKHYPSHWWYRIFTDENEGAYCWHTSQDWMYAPEITMSKLFRWRDASGDRYSVKEVSMLEIVVVAGYPEVQNGK